MQDASVESNWKALADKLRFENSVNDENFPEYKAVRKPRRHFDQHQTLAICVFEVITAAVKQTTNPDQPNAAPADISEELSNYDDGAIATSNTDKSQIKRSLVSCYPV